MINYIKFDLNLSVTYLTITSHEMSLSISEIDQCSKVKKIRKNWLQLLIEKSNADNAEIISINDVPFEKIISDKIKVKRNDKCIFKTLCGEINKKEIRSIVERTGMKTEKEILENKLQKMQDTLFENFGCKNPMQLETVKEKCRRICLEKYGCLNPAQSQEIRKKIRATCLKNHGCEHHMQCPTIKDKVEKTFLDKYGVKNYMLSDEFICKKKSFKDSNVSAVQPRLKDKPIKKSINSMNQQTNHINENICLEIDDNYFSNNTENNEYNVNLSMQEQIINNEKNLEENYDELSIDSLDAVSDNQVNSISQEIVTNNFSDGQINNSSDELVVNSQESVENNSESNEIWKTIPDFSNYEISTLGRLRNKNTKKYIKGTCKRGWLSVCMPNDNKKPKTMFLHRLVALTFIPNPHNKRTVNHKNHKRDDNRLSNLEWATYSEQSLHQRKPKRAIKRLVSSRKVWRLDPNTNEKLELYETMRDAAKWIYDNNLTSVKDFNGGNNIKTKICAVARKRLCIGSGRNHNGPSKYKEYQRKTAYGYKWIYDDSDQNIYDDEIWKDIPPSLIHETKNYKISSYGRVRNHKGRISVGSKNSDHEYKWVTVNVKKYQLHRLVALVFIPNPNNKPFVNHKDGNKKNNCLTNLEWCTPSENSRHAIDIGLKDSYLKPVIQFDYTMVPIKEFKSMSEASRKTGINTTCIYRSCKKIRGIIKPVKDSNGNLIGGFFFRFKKDVLKH